MKNSCLHLELKTFSFACGFKDSEMWQTCWEASTSLAMEVAVWKSWLPAQAHFSQRFPKRAFRTRIPCTQRENPSRDGYGKSIKVTLEGSFCSVAVEIRHVQDGKPSRESKAQMLENN